MLRVAPFALLLSSAAWAQGTSEAPRVGGQGEAAAAQVLVNEANSDAYPEVTLFATVTQNGAPVTGLGADDFRVREDEVDQAPLTVEEQLPALSVVVTMDVSGSMADRLADAQAAATSFVEGLGEQDSVQLVTFAREVEVVTPMTSTKDGVTDAIAQLAARGDTALYDALLQSVDLVAERSGRKAIVVLSDGVDDDGTGQPLSEATVNDVLARAAEVNAPIFVVGLGTELDEAGLTQIASESGALYLPAPTPEELAGVYDQIGAQLSGQYAISYTSSLPQDGTARRVSLEALGATGSKEYTFAGAAATENAAEVDEQAAAPVDECAPHAALVEARPGLDQAKARYDEDLISITERDNQRMTILNEVQLTFSEPFGLDCAVSVITEAGALYQADVVTITDRDNLRQLAQPALEAEVVAMENPDDALRLANDLYEQDVISITTRDQLRAAILASD